MKALKIIGLWLGLVLLRIVVQAPLGRLADTGGIAEVAISSILSLAITIVFIVVGVKFTKKIRNPGRHPDNCSCLGCYNSRA